MIPNESYIPTNLKFGDQIYTTLQFESLIFFHKFNRKLRTFFK